MNHLTLEQLLELREPGLSPGTASARTHLDGCPQCRRELDGLDQRAARLRALPALRPARDRWPVIRAQAAAQRRHRRMRRMSMAGLAMAASIAAVMVVGDISAHDASAPPVAAIDSVKAQSRALENALRRLNPDARVTDGRTAHIAAELEDRIAALDRQLQASELGVRRVPQAQTLELWRERVGLLDALMDVHLTRATNVGL